MNLNTKYNTPFKMLVGWLGILTLLNSPSLVLYLLNGETKYFFVAPIVTGCLYMMPLFLFHARIKWYAYLLMPISLLAPAAVGVAFFFRETMSTSILMLLFESSWQNKIDVLLQVLLPFTITLLASIFAYLYFVKLLPSRLSFGKSVVISAIASLLIFVTPLLRYGYSKYYIPNLNTQNVHFYPFYLKSSLRKVKKRLSIIQNYAPATESFRFNAYKKDSLSQQEIYVLVIGESARYDHWSINGYGRATSPRLLKRDDVLTFPDFLAGGHNTMLSVPIMITRATAENYELCYHEKSIVSAFKEAGFKTYWLANVISYGTPSIDIHAKDADELIYVSSELGESSRYDGSIVNKLDQILATETANKLFFVLHTAGSHVVFSDRYPDDFNQFQPSGKNFQLNSLKTSHQPFFINCYDNTILYTDFFLDKLYTTLQKQDATAWAWYSSDHGDYLFDSEQQQIFHADPDSITLHVPVFLWTSPNYEQTYPLKYAAVNKHRTLPLSLNDFFYSLIDMANIGMADNKEDRSIAQPDFKPSPRYYIKDEKPAIWDSPK